MNNLLCRIHSVIATIDKASIGFKNTKTQPQNPGIFIVYGRRHYSRKYGLTPVSVDVVVTAASRNDSNKEVGLIDIHMQISNAEIQVSLYEI